jgi:hypothetical protein
MTLWLGPRTHLEELLEMGRPHRGDSPRWGFRSSSGPSGLKHGFESRWGPHIGEQHARVAAGRPEPVASAAGLPEGSHEPGDR